MKHVRSNNDIEAVWSEALLRRISLKIQKSGLQERCILEANLCSLEKRRRYVGERIGRSLALQRSKRPACRPAGARTDLQDPHKRIRRNALADVTYDRSQCLVESARKRRILVDRARLGKRTIREDQMQWIDLAAQDTSERPATTSEQPQFSIGF